jgi:hypothetical protein
VSTLKSSAFKLSCHGDFPFFHAFIVVAISCLSGTEVLISKSLTASIAIASSSGAGLLSTTLKYSAHLAFC